MCSEDDLIAAIEKQLNIKLMKKTQRGTDEKQSKEKSDEWHTDGDDLVQVTEQDVEEVVSFMNSQDDEIPLETNAAAISEGGRKEGMERGTDGRNSVIIKDGLHKQDSALEVASPSSPKNRLSSFVIIDASDLPSEQQTDTRTPRTEGLQEDQVECVPDTNAGRPLIPSWPRDEEEEDSEKSIRGNRSSSVGLKPLRRVKARRRTNPASDMVNLSPGS